MKFPFIMVGAPIVAVCLLSACAVTEKPVNVVAYVANAGNNNVQLIDVKSGETLNKLYTGAAPWRLLKSPDGKRLLVQHWYAETTAVVDLASNRIEQSLPVRGPAVFSPEGDRLWSYSWPASLLHAYDSKTFKPMENRLTEDKAVYDMVFWGKDLLAQGQYDPISLTGREVYESVLVANLANPKSLSSLARTGTSPARLVLDPSGELLLTANVDDRGVTILNKNGDGRRITLAPGPRDIVFNKNGKQMIVIAWPRHSQESDIFTLETNFETRPWPEIKAQNSLHMRGGFVDAEMGADGLLYVLDRPGKRLIAFDPDTLKEKKSIPVGDDPMAFVLRQVSAAERTQLAKKPASRKRLEEIIARMKGKAAPFKDVSFTETLTQYLPDGAGTAEKDNDKDKKETANTETISTSTRTRIRLPDSVRQELANGGVRLGQGGQATLITKGGSYNTTPRQELIHVLYVLNALPVDEVIRQLAGDVPGSVFLRNGIAVDIVHSVEEEGKHYFAIGAAKKGELVSQLWVSAESGLPVDLVEQFPVIRSQNPHQPAEEFQGLAETKLEYAKVGERTFPARLLRYIDGKPIGEVTLDEVAFDQNPAPSLFQLTQLGGVLKPVNKQPESAKGIVSGPGLAVASQGTAHVNAPLDLHPAYNSNPATSGWHTRYTADAGVHKIPLPPEVQVSNLINGAVLVQYACPQDCPGLVKQLEAMVEKHEQVIVAPYPLMESKIALTAWQRIDTLKEFDEKRISAFIEAYAGKKHPHNKQDMPQEDDAGAMMMPPNHPPMQGGPQKMPHK